MTKRNKLATAATYAAIRDSSAALLQYLEANSTVVKSTLTPIEDGIIASYIIEEEDLQTISLRFRNEWNSLRAARCLDVVPMADQQHLLYLFDRYLQNEKITISATAIRLPYLSVLLNLTPEDFFSLMAGLSKGHTIGSGTCLTVDVPELEQVSDLFVPVTANLSQRLRSEICQDTWVSKDVIKKVSKLPPTLNNQLLAIQYLSIFMEEAAFKIPNASVVDLELSLTNYDDEYCLIERDML